MADYGNKNSTKRRNWYDRVIGPLQQMADAAGEPHSLPDRISWLNKPKPIGPNSYPKDMREAAKAIGYVVGVEWTKDHFANLSRATSYVQQLQAAKTAYDTAGGALGVTDETAPSADDPTTNDYGLGAGLESDLTSYDDSWATPPASPPAAAPESTEGGFPVWGWFVVGGAVLAVGGMVVWATTRSPSPRLPMAPPLPPALVPAPPVAGVAAFYNHPYAGEVYGPRYRDYMEG